MLSHLLAPALARRGVHYGWVMVALTFLVSLSSAGALGILGALLLPLQREFAWDTGTISGALALRLLLFGLMAPFAAALLQRAVEHEVGERVDEAGGLDDGDELFRVEHP